MLATRCVSFPVVGLKTREPALYWSTMNENVLELRRAASNDAALIWGVRTQAIRAGCRTHYSSHDVEQWASVLMHAEFPHVIEQMEFFLMCDGVRIVAFGFLDKDKAEVGGMFVHPDFQGLGLGRRILAFLEKIARQAKLSALSLTSSLNAEKFYSAAGFKPIERTKWNHPNGFELPCVNMSKELKSSLSHLD